MLAESMDSGKADVADMEFYRSQAKQIFKTLSRKSPNKMSIESGGYYFAYVFILYRIVISINIIYKYNSL